MVNGSSEFKLSIAVWLKGDFHQQKNSATTAITKFLIFGKIETPKTPKTNKPVTSESLPVIKFENWYFKIKSLSNNTSNAVINSGWNNSLLLFFILIQLPCQHYYVFKTLLLSLQVKNFSKYHITSNR
jgi:hypothetical protein